MAEPECPYEGTKVANSMATKNNKASRVTPAYGFNSAGGFETNVCDAHLAKAQKEYPHRGDKEPQ